jgi:hypothetical protein
MTSRKEFLSLVTGSLFRDSRKIPSAEKHLLPSKDNYKNFHEPIPSRVPPEQQMQAAHHPEFSSKSCVAGYILRFLTQPSGRSAISGAAILNGPYSKYAMYRRRVLFIAGVGLIAGSFLVYLAYPVVVLLPLSANLKIAVIIIASLLSWSAFSIGVLLAGVETYEWLKDLLKRRVVRW